MSATRTDPPAAPPAASLEDVADAGTARYRWLPWLLAATLAVFALLYVIALQSSHREFIHDDAFIALRYARNLATGHGLVWNLGEPIEGYTSLAAVLLCGAIGAIGISFVTAALIVNLGGIGLAVGSVLRYVASRRQRSEWAPLLVTVPVCLAATNKDLWVWTYGRLEAPLYAGMVAVALAAVLRALEHPTDWRCVGAAAGAIGLLPITRPDGALLVAIAVGAVWLAGRRFVGGRRRLALFIAFAAAPAVLQMVFRLAYYGDFLPNTVWAKAIGVPPAVDRWGGLDYVLSYLRKPPYVAATALVLTPLALRDGKTRLAALFLASCLVGHLAMVGAAGGDHMVGHRMLVPALSPAVFLLFLELRALAALASPASPAWPRAIAVAVATATVLAMMAQRTARADSPDPAAFTGAIVGRYLAEHYPPGTLVALATAGATPYFAPELRFIDTLGLNDRHIAHRRIERARLHWQGIPGHAKGDGAYVLERNPKVIILGPAQGTLSDEPWFLGDLELHESAAFHRRYTARTVNIPVDDVRWHDRYGATHTGTLQLVYYERISAAR